MLKFMSIKFLVVLSTSRSITGWLSRIYHYELILTGPVSSAAVVCGSLDSYRSQQLISVREIEATSQCPRLPRPPQTLRESEPGGITDGPRLLLFMWLHRFPKLEPIDKDGSMFVFG